MFRRGREKRPADEGETRPDADGWFTASAVAASHSATSPSLSAAIVRAEKSVSLCSTRSTRSRAPEEGPSRHGPTGLRRTIKPDVIYASFDARSPEAKP